MNLMIIIQFVPAFIIIIVLCRLLGRFMQVIGQPRVIGEMIAGVMLGPSLMGHASPQLSTMLFSEEVKQLLQALSSAGLGIYMFLVGLEIDRQLMNKKNLSKCTLLSIVGIVPSFVLGIAAGAMYVKDFAPAGIPSY